MTKLTNNYNILHAYTYMYFLEWPVK